MFYGWQFSFCLIFIFISLLTFNYWPQLEHICNIYTFIPRNKANSCDIYRGQREEHATVKLFFTEIFKLGRGKRFYK